MAVKYVNEFTFAPSPPRPTVKGYARGGHVKASTPQPYAKGGTAKCYSKGGSPDIKVGASRSEKSSGVQKPAFADGGHWIAGATKNKGALHRKLGVPAGEKIPAKKLNAATKKGGVEGKEANLAKTLKSFHKADGGTIKVADAEVGMGRKTAWNRDDATSPGSPKRTPMAEKDSNQSAARNKFATEGRGTPVATKQDGNVERMSGYSDFAKGGRIKNLGHYAHGGKVKSTKSEVSSGKAGSAQVKAPVAKSPKATTEQPDSSKGSRVEMKSGTAHAAMGGFSRGTGAKKNAAIHAKMAHKSGPGLGALASALSGMGAPHQGAAAPPGMAPGMGSPPGGQMGAIAPQAPTMGGGPPAMSHGGGVKHVIVHHVSHGRR
jgi:hypothetical protein